MTESLWLIEQFREKVGAIILCPASETRLLPSLGCGSHQVNEKDCSLDTMILTCFDDAGVRFKVVLLRKDPFHLIPNHLGESLKMVKDNRNAHIVDPFHWKK